VLSKSFSTRAGEVDQAAPSEHPRAFVRDPYIDSLIADVRFGELKTSAQPALLKTTGSTGQNELYDRLLSYQDCSDEEEVFWKALGTVEGVASLHPGC
jgi:hypothetical protein